MHDLDAEILDADPNGTDADCRAQTSAKPRGPDDGPVSFVCWLRKRIEGNDEREARERVAGRYRSQDSIGAGPLFQLRKHPNGRFESVNLPTGSPIATPGSPLWPGGRRQEGKGRAGAC